jgi:L-ribulose-5-phosphate 3-epimerase
VKPPVGIMQGRLLPPYEGRFQAFPAKDWREEFDRAETAGLHCIEWIYEKPHEADNPLGSATGLGQMREAISRTGVGVHSICADYYMTEQLVDTAHRPDAARIEHLRWLIGQAKELGITYIVLPFVDSSTMSNGDRIASAKAAIRAALPRAEAAGIELHLETDLAPQPFMEFLEDMRHPLVKANYDIGNSASLGYRPETELAAIGPWLGSVHVKDRVLRGGTVPLGTGNADLETSFRMIRGLGFDRWFVLQAARGEEGGEVPLAASNRGLVERLWSGAA